VEAYFGPTIEIDLAAIARNYGRIKSQLSKARCGAVVKANAYGLGAEQAAVALHNAGCRDFFVATLEEGLRVRTRVKDAAIYVFHGFRKGQQPQDFIAHNLTPVLNDIAQIEAWNNAASAALHIDTGMCRLGLTPDDLTRLPPIARTVPLVLSHLACASDPAHPKNKEQLALFKQILNRFPGIPASFANSSGVALGSDYHFDLARPGRALYGITRGTTFPPDMENVVTLSAPVMQYRALTQDETVGYGATTVAKKGSVLATVEFGYADGFMRSLAGKVHGYAAGVRVPVVGIISMDMVSVDVTAVPAHLRTPDLRITFIGKEQPIDVIAEMAGTIGYEVFTGLGPRIKRIYI